MSVRLARLVVGLALWLFPPGFRRRFGGGMRDAFTQRIVEARARGHAALLRALARTLVDVAVSAAREWIDPTHRHHAGRSASARSPLVDAVREDLRFALRSLVRRPGFAMVAIATLAGGLGATTAVFSVVDGVLLTPLPYPEPERIVSLGQASVDDPDRHGSMSRPDLADLEATGGLEHVVGYAEGDLALTGQGEAEVLRSTSVTDGLLATFGLSPVLGRDLSADDAHEGGHARVVLAHAFWLERYGADRAVLGRTLQLDGRAFEIVGVAPAGFDFPGRMELYRPFELSDGCGRDCRILRGIGRLTAGTSAERARTEVDALAARLSEALPASNLDVRFRVIPLQERSVGDARNALWILLGAVGLVLLIVCANVANLLLVRAQTRATEVAVRAALGASRTRIAAQVLSESLVLAVLGGVGGLGIAWVGVWAIRTLGPADLPRLDQVGLDGTVLLFAGALVLSVTVLFGAVPALQISRTCPAQGMASTARGGSNGPRARGRSLLLMGEVALSMVLLAGAGLLLKSFARLLDVDPGFETEHVVRFTLSLPEHRYADLAAVGGFFDRVEAELGALPGVVSVGSLFGAPMSRVSITADVHLDGWPEPPPGRASTAAVRGVTAGAIETLGIPLLRGRALRGADREHAQAVALVSQSFVDAYLHGADPIGERVKLDVDLGFGSPLFEIVGVVGDIRAASLTGETPPAVYVPLAQMGPGYATVHVRTLPGTPPPLAAMRAVVSGLDADLPLRELETLGDVTAREMAPNRFYLILIGSFAAVAVALAAFGLYGVVVYLVTRRTREVGVRRALGAGRTDVLRMLVVEGARPALLGVAIGLGVALWSAPVLGSLLYDVDARDPAVFAGVAVLLVGVVFGAAVVPARRATAAPASWALRHD